MIMITIDVHLFQRKLIIPNLHTQTHIQRHIQTHTQWSQKIKTWKTGENWKDLWSGIYKTN